MALSIAKVAESKRATLQSEVTRLSDCLATVDACVQTRIVMATVEDASQLMEMRVEDRNRHTQAENSALERPDMIGTDQFPALPLRFAVSALSRLNYSQQPSHHSMMMMLMDEAEGGTHLMSGGSGGGVAAVFEEAPFGVVAAMAGTSGASAGSGGGGGPGANGAATSATSQVAMLKPGDPSVGSQFMEFLSSVGMSPAAVMGDDGEDDDDEMDEDEFY